MKNVPRSRRSSASLILAVLLDGERYGIPFEYVDEVLPALPIESLPECPPYIRGIVLIRDQLILVIDAAQRLLLRNHRPPSEPNIVCLRVDGKLLGLQVDEALELVEIPTSVRLDLTELSTTEAFCSDIREVGGAVIRILNPMQLLPEMRSLRDMETAHRRRNESEAELLR